MHKLPPNLCHTVEPAIERQGVGELDKSVDDVPALAAGLRAYHDRHVGEPDHNSDGAGAGDAGSGIKPDEGIHLERRLLAEDKVEEASQIGQLFHDACERVEDTDDPTIRCPWSSRRCSRRTLPEEVCKKVIASSSTGPTPVPSQSATQPRGWKRRSARVGSRGLGVDERQCVHTARKTMYSATSSSSTRSAMSLVLSGWSDVQSRSSDAAASMRRLPPLEINSSEAAALRLPLDLDGYSIHRTKSHQKGEFFVLQMTPE